MNKGNRKVDILIVIVLVLSVLSIFLLVLFPNGENGGTVQAKDASELTIADFADKKIGVATGTLFETFVKEHYPEATICYYNSNIDLTAALKSGKIDTFLLSDEAAGILVDEEPLITYIDENAGSFEAGMVLPKNAAGEKLKAQMDEYLTRIKADGTLDSIMESWMTEEAKERFVDLSGLTGENGTLRCATSGDEMPDSYVVNGKPAGFDPDIIAHFCREYGYGLEITISDFSGILPGIVSGMYDVACNEVIITEERKANVNFSVPYMSAPVVMMVKRGGDIPEKNLSDYNGKTIGVQTGTTFDKMIQEKLPSSSVVYYNSYNDLLTSLKTGAIDAFGADEPIVKYMMTNDSSVTYLGDYMEQYEFGFAFPKNESGKALCDSMSGFIRRIRDDGTLEEIESIWFGDDESRKVLPDIHSLPDNNGVLKLATESSNAPFVYMKNGALAGYEADIAYRFCKEYGYGLEIMDMSFDSVIPSLAHGKCDLGAASMTITDERAESVYFSEPVYSGGAVLAVRVSDLTGEDAGGNAVLTFFEDLASDISESFKKNFIREERYKLILEGILTTMIITVASAAFGSVLAFLICMFRRTGSRLAVAISKIYVKLLQGTPMVVLLMILYYVILGKSGLEAVWVAIIGFSLNFGAYASEIMRSGIESIDPGQREAALALGYSENQAFFRFVFPQAAARFMPVYRGEIVSLLKSTSIVGYIAIQDLTKMSDIIRSRTYEAFFPLIVTAIIYFMLAWLLTLLLKLIARFITPKRKRPEIRLSQHSCDII